MANTDILRVEFPLGTVIAASGKNGTVKLEYNKRYITGINKSLNNTQAYLDTLVINNLKKYVSFRTGMQEASIPLSSIPGSGKVHINVPYAKYQAYSKRIKKRVGKRGTQPFERMCADKKDSIYLQVLKFARRFN